MLQKQAPCTWLDQRASGMASSASPVLDQGHLAWLQMHLLYPAVLPLVWLRNRPFPVKHIPWELLWRPDPPRNGWEWPLH